LDNAETIDGLAKAVSSMPHLAHLKADDVPTFEPLNGQRIAKPAQPLQKLLRVLAGRSNVRSYDSFPPLSEASLPTFVQFLRNNPYLTHLRLEFAFETATLGPDFLKLCEAVAALKNLQSLQLCFGSLDPRAFDLLQGIVHNGFNLKHLALEAPPSPHGPTPHLVAASWRLGAKLVQESPHLQSLHLAYWPHTAAKAADPEAQGLSEAMGALEAALQKLESLASLKISGRLGSTDGIPTQPLYSLIASAASLRRLDLGFVGQSTTEVLHLLKSAAPLPRLEDLLLHLADEHLFNDDLAMAVASFKYLRRLKIRLVDSEEASTLTLAFGAMALPRLESFKLSAPQRHLTEPPDSPLTDAFPGLFALQGVTFEWED